MSAIKGPIILIGAGNMGGAMALGWVRSGIAPQSIIAADPNPQGPMKTRLAEAGIGFVSEPPKGVKAGVLFIAVKPQVMGEVLPAYRTLVGPDTIIVSVAAGKTLGFIEANLGEAAMVRAMPNTPAMIGRGVTGAFANEHVTPAQRAAVDALLKVSGPVEWVETEALIDAVTAVSGSGPAYVFHLVECMAEAGRKLGLPADLSMRLARATVSGAGELLHQSPGEAAELRKNVTSPGGTTAAALAVLMAEDGLQPLFDAAIKAARDRAEELAG
ncbi:pyrroline-5-carboxylate reductase [Rhizobium sp. FKL33]|uniref:pyrroline-5-carboxylate reductase n=1 Tax=Rhizobium sp. FKL33 TaxID=2562307 RepID=UPI0010BF77B2|nr:pyrroline-5-carboxylate reductase [Rhizobium sp. FKL33]